nr:hypothetical protein [Cohnella faecalis]
MGERKIDLHLRGLPPLARTSKRRQPNCMQGQEADRRRNYSGFPSVGATENIMMAAVLAKGARQSSAPPASRKSRICSGF